MSKNWEPAKSNGHVDLPDRFKDLHVDTRLLKTHSTSDAHLKKGTPLMPPIFTTSTFSQSNVQEYLDIINHGGHIYQRLGNPSTDVVEAVINELEDGNGSMVFSSGLAAATTTFLCFLKSGDHLLIQNPCYSGTYEFARATLAKFGVNVETFPAGLAVADLRTLIKPETKMIYGETPSNPDMTLFDLVEFGKLSLEREDIMTVVDGTFASPYLQPVIPLGIDISVHSCSKYMGGHTDLIAGSVTVRNVLHWKQLKNYCSTNGQSLGPFDAYLLFRGLKTLPIRMERICSNAMQVATYLEAHPKVEKVMYPGLKSHPQHEMAKKQMKRMFGGMISFEMFSLEAAKMLNESVKVVNLAVSLGGTESLMEHPASMTHGPMLMGDEERKQCRITDGLLRLSVGLEHVDDIIADFAEALELC